MSTALQVVRIRAQANKLVALLLGQDIRLERFLPEYLSEEKEESKARYLAEMILFWAARSDFRLETETLGEINTWLYEIILYLLTQCVDNDHTFQGILDILRLSLESRTILLGDAKHMERFQHVATEPEPPIQDEELEVIFYNMALKACNLQKRFDRLLTFMKEL